MLPNSKIRYIRVLKLLLVLAKEVISCLVNFESCFPHHRHHALSLYWPPLFDKSYVHRVCLHFLCNHSALQDGYSYCYWNECLFPIAAQDQDLLHGLDLWGDRLPYLCLNLLQNCNFFRDQGDEGLESSVQILLDSLAADQFLIFLAVVFLLPKITKNKNKIKK